MRGSRMIKAATAILTIGYCSLLVYLGGVPFNFQVYRPRTEPVTNLPLDAVTKATSVVNVNKTSVVDSAQNRNITLDDVFITVKTSRIYQSSRLPIILKTWFQLAKNQTWFFTDTDSEVYQKQTNGHMVNTNCPPTHELRDLCCKTAMEYDHFMESGKKWLCHFDDDNYVNVPRLLAVLRGYNYQEDWYLGRTAVYEQIKFKNRAFLAPHLMFSFWFATGGAGFCISRSLALKMSPVASDGNFISVCERIRLPDDVTMGFIIESLVKSKLTVIPEFHSHLEQMKLISPTTFKDQISFSYSRNKKDWNVVDVPGFNTRYDPTRFLSLHCFLFPHFEYCPRK